MTLSPTPGSDEAVARGCTCPIMDNARGAGVVIGGQRQFWQTGGCPVHTPRTVWPSVAGGSGAAVSHGGEDG